jgi:predicted anti-sigma-YlaC factor YlaD
MNTCPEKTVWVLYAADELPASERAALRSHLESCPACRAENAAVARGLAALESLDAGPQPRTLALAQLRQRLAAEPARTSRRRWAWVAAAAAVIVAAGVTWSLMRPDEASAPSSSASATMHWMDDTAMTDELAEIAAGVEMLESADALTAYEVPATGNGPAPAKSGGAQSLLAPAAEWMQLACARG